MAIYKDSKYLDFISFYYDEANRCLSVVIVDKIGISNPKIEICPIGDFDDYFCSGIDVTNYFDREPIVQYDIIKGCIPTYIINNIDSDVYVLLVSGNDGNGVYHNKAYIFANIGRYYKCSFKALRQLIDDNCDYVCDKCDECSKNNRLIVDAYLLFIISLDMGLPDEVSGAYDNIKYLCDMCDVCDYDDIFYPELKCVLEYECYA